MGAATGGESGASTTRSQLQTGFLPSSPTNSSIPASAGPTTAHLLALFQECVDAGIWASLETQTWRGVVNVDFCCSIPAAGQPRARRKRKQRPRDAARTRQWKENRQKQRTQLSPSTPQVSSALPVAPSATVNGPATKTATATSTSPTAARSFAAVAAQPSQEVRTTPTPSAAAASTRQSKAKGINPVKRVKNTLAASRVSQRAAILSKKRTASAVPATSPNQVFEEDAPELLREKDGGRA